MITNAQQEVLRNEAETLARHLSKITNDATIACSAGCEETIPKVMEAQDFFRREVVRNLSMIVEGKAVENDLSIREMCRK